MCVATRSCGTRCLELLRRPALRYTMRDTLNRWGRTARFWLRVRRRSRSSHRVGWIEGRFRPSRPARNHGPFARRECDYYLYVPADLTAYDRVPLVVMLHGCGQDARTFAEGTRMNALADVHHFIVLYPEQSRRANPLRCWRWFDRETVNGAGEAALIAGLVRNIARNYPVDRSRVYVAGISAGGAMASVLAFCYGATFAACAIVSGVMYRAADSMLEAAMALSRGSRTRPQAAAGEAARRSSPYVGFVPALVMHGDRDSTVHPHNADQIIQQFQAFAELTGASPAPLVESEERRVMSVGHAYRLRDYLRNDRVLLRKIIVEGMGHAWSGGDERHRFNDAEGPDASQLIWDFVSEFRRKSRRHSRFGARWSRFLGRFRQRGVGSP
jgi:poly(hydroxyalkanoate) depolymerase family esterase